jgi:hypothetical protein
VEGRVITTEAVVVVGRQPHPLVVVGVAQQPEEEEEKLHLHELDEVALEGQAVSEQHGSNQTRKAENPKLS